MAGEPAELRMSPYYRADAVCVRSIFCCIARAAPRHCGERGGTGAMSEAIAAGDGIVQADSVTRLGPEDAGKVLIGASHGGVYAANLAARAGLRAVILNDAGIGKDAAGIAGLAYLDEIGMAAATIGHDTARIGDGRDMAARGIISRVNAAAA